MNLDMVRPVIQAGDVLQALAARGHVQLAVGHLSQRIQRQHLTAGGGIVVAHPEAAALIARHQSRRLAVATILKAHSLKNPPIF